MDPRAVRRRPVAVSFQTQRDGLPGCCSVVPVGQVGQRRFVPLRAGALDAARRQIERAPAERLDPEGAQERPLVVAEHGDEHLGGRPETLTPRLRVHLGHDERSVGTRKPVEADPATLRQHLPELDVVALAAALLVGAAGVAVEEPRLTLGLAEQPRDPVFVGELRAVVGGHEPEYASHAAGAQGVAHEAEARQRRGARPVRDRYRELEARWLCSVKKN